MDVLYYRPRDHSRSGCDHGDQHRVDGDTVSCETGTAVESQPSEPEQCESYEDHGHAVPSLHHTLASPADEYGKCQTCRCSTYVDHCASSEVKDGEVLIEESASPHPVGHRCVHQYGPECHEYGDGVESDPLHACTQYDARSDECEHHLEYHELHVGYGAPVGDRIVADPVEQDLIQVAYDPAYVPAECK